MSDRITIVVEPERARARDVAALFQRGVLVPFPRSRSVADFLAVDLGIDPAYIRDTIATVFVDSMVVDDLDRAMLHPGSTLTLSAAMPGLVGATLRRSSYYAAMRAEVSWHDLDPDGGQGGAAATLRIKLFNLIIPGVGPAILRRGIVLPRGEAIGLVGSDTGLERVEEDHEILLRVAA